MVIKKLITGTAAVPLSVIAALLIIYFFFLPPVLKYIIEDQGEKQLGRKVEVGYAGFNIFRGSVNIKGFTVFEPDGQHKFLSFRRFYINFNVPDLFRKVYHIESVGLEEPIIHIFQVDSTFNFTDILDRFSSDSTAQSENETRDDTTRSEGPVKYIVENFSLTSGIISYANPDFKLKDTLMDLNLSVPEVSYENALIKLAFYFNLASGGNFRGNCTWNGENQTIILSDTIENFNLSNYKHYLDPYLKAGSLQGYLHTHNLLIANTSTYDLSLAGNLSLTDFALTDSAGATVAGFRKFSVSFDTISFSEDILSFDTISLVEPVINFILTPEGDNFSALMPVSASEDTISTGQMTETAYSGENPVEMMVAYVQESMQAYLFQNYRINQVQLLNGKISYDDRTLDEPFLATIDSLHLILRNLTTEVDRSFGSLDARMNGEGNLHAQISVNPRDLLDMDLKYEINSLMVPDFNPFSVYYIAYPFPRGAFNYNGSLAIVNRKLNSENKIVIEKIYLGEKVDNTTAIGLPIKLAIAILRDRQGDIRLNIPVAGDLNDPKFKIGRLILDILKNLIIKAATAPYDLLASAFGGNEEDYKDLRYGYLQAIPGEKQQGQLARIASILTDKPELNVSFSQVVDPAKEKAEIALFETKKIYLYEFIRNQEIPERLTGKDSLEINAIDEDKDLHDFFASRLDETLMALSLEEKCYYLAGVEKVNQMEQSLMTARNLALKLYLKDVLLIPEERFLVATASDPALINPEYPYFTIKFDVKE